MTYTPNERRYEDVPFRRCGRSGLVLPPISLGTWQNFGGVNVYENCRAVLRRAFDRGVTHFDLANMYGPPNGSAEENVGRILRDDFRSLRDELVISTKAGYEMWPGPYGIGASRKHLVASLDVSLQRLGLDHVDILSQPVVSDSLCCSGWSHSASSCTTPSGIACRPRSRRNWDSRSTPTRSRSRAA